MPTTTITDIRTIGITVADQDKALEFFTATLGFEKRLDAPISPTMRWIEAHHPGPAHRSPSSAATPHRPAAPTRRSGSPFRMSRPSTPRWGNGESPSARSCAGTVFRRCSLSTTPTGTGSSSSKGCPDDHE